MTDAEKRIAIHEARGRDPRKYFCETCNRSVEISESTSGGSHKKCGRHLECAMPDYLNDLNAMHEAEKCLFKQGPTLAATYCANLMKLRMAHFSIRHQIELPALCASARERADAYIKTIGKI